MTDFFSHFHFEHLQVANSILIIGTVMFLGSVGGFIFKKLRVPQVVGYIITGILLGLSGSRLLGSDVLANMAPFSSFALALIGFLIGAELKISVIKKYGKQFVGILLLEAIVPFFTVAGLITLVAWLISGNFTVSAALGLVLGAISSATAPAATTDVLTENRTKGPLTTILLGIVAMDDALALILYAVASTIAAGFIGAHAASFGAQLLSILYKVFGSIAVGLAAGFILGRIIRFIKNDEGRTLSFALGVIMVATGASSFARLDTILVAMAMGFYIVNFVPIRSGELFRVVTKFTPPVYVLFFVLVGANLNLRVVTPVLALLAVIYVIGRTIGKSIGAAWGARLTGAPDTVRKYLKWCLLSQAGVAIGLSISASNAFKGTPIGEIIPLIITATTFIVQLIGPLCVKYGVTKAGECGLAITEDDLMKTSVIADVSVKGISVCSPQNHAVIPETESVKAILDEFSREDNLNFAVKSTAGTLSGIITLEHLKEALLVPDMVDCLAAVDIMDPAAVSCLPDTVLSEVYEMFGQYDIEVIPVADKDHKVLGLAEKHTIDRYLHIKILELQQKAACLEAMPQ